MTFYVDAARLTRARVARARCAATWAPTRRRSCTPSHSREDFNHVGRTDCAPVFFSTTTSRLSSVRMPVCSGQLPSRKRTLFARRGLRQALVDARYRKPRQMPGLETAKARLATEIPSSNLLSGSKLGFLCRQALKGAFARGSNRGHQARFVLGLYRGRDGGA